MRVWRVLAAVVLVLSFAVAEPRPAFAYSVLTHEQLIDLTWDSSIVPLLLSRYPTLTPAQIEHARAYAYGGCVIQDIGYYPFGDPFFSDLTHYVRTGDFVVNLFRNAGNADELAFAVGALSHYIGDSIGHQLATNLSVPMEFPKLKDRYGNVVNYAEGEHQHVQTEFAFDVNEIVHRRFAPVHYLRHVGLEVPTKQVALAFYQTYGLREDFQAKRGGRINVGGYRFAVHRLIPRVAYAETLLHRKHEPADVPDVDMQKLDADLAVVMKENNWDGYRKHAGVGTYMLAGLIAVLPKVGSLKILAVKGPTQATDKLYIHSVVMSEDALAHAVRHFTPPPAVKSSAATAAASDPHADSPGPAKGAGAASAAADAKRAATPSVGPLSASMAKSQPAVLRSADPRHPLVNRDLDTGLPVRPSGYRLTDDTYAKLLHRLAATPTVAVPPGIKEDILAYYADLSLPFATKKKVDLWAEVQKDLATMQGMPTSTEPDPFQTYGDDDTDAADAAAKP